MITEATEELRKLTESDFAGIRSVFDLKKAGSSLEFIPTHEPHGYGNGHLRLFLEWIQKVSPVTAPQSFQTPTELTSDMLRLTTAGQVFYSPEFSGGETVFSLNAGRITKELAFTHELTQSGQVKKQQQQFAVELRKLLNLPNTPIRPIHVEQRACEPVAGFPAEKLILETSPGIMVLPC